MARPSRIVGRRLLGGRKCAALAAIVALAVADGQAARGDGGLLRLCRRSGAYQVAIFTSPTPLRAGDVDFSALVQDASTSAVLSDARVVFRLTPPGGAGGTIEYPATAKMATNKLAVAAQFKLPTPGTWRMDILVDGPLGRTRIECPLEVAAAMPRWLDMAPWIALPAAAIALFALREALAKRRHNHPM